MTNPEVEYASEEETDRFILLFCDRTDEVIGDESAIRFKVAAQLHAEIAEKNKSDLSSIEDKRQFATRTYIIFNSFSQLAHRVLMDETLLKSDYMKFMGALWRTMPEKDIVKDFSKNPCHLARILEERNYTPPAKKQGLYEGLGLVDPVRTRRSQHRNLTEGRRRKS